MYRKFYGLKELPFNLTPDTKFLFLSKVHKEALAHLVYGIEERKGFMLITGEVGSGKTTLCRALLNKMSSNTKVALILNSFLSDIELLKSINEEFFLKSDIDSKKVLIDELNRFLLVEHSQGNNVILIIDEAQNLSPESLEQIRMISNLETETDKLIQIILMGQPEFNDILMLPSLKQLNQRITVRYHLEPLKKEEIPQYIHHRLKVAGAQAAGSLSGKEVIFEDDAIELLYEFTNGIPRVINIACDRCLLTGYVKNTTEITAEIMKESIGEVAGRYSQELIKNKSLYNSMVKRRGFSINQGYNQGMFRWIALIVFIIISSIIGYGLLKSSNKLIYVPTIDEKILLSALTESSRLDKSGNITDGVKLMPSIANLQETQSRASDIQSPNTDILNASNRIKELSAENYESERLNYRNWERDENNIIRVNNRNFTELASIATLLSFWGIDVDLTIFKDASPREVFEFDLIQFIKDAGIYRIDYQTNFAQLVKLDLPVILEMDKNNLYVSPYIVLIGITEKELIVADPIFGKMKIKRRDLDQIWFGNAICVFVENNILSQLSYGMKSKEVGILQQYLKRLGYFHYAITNKYDKYTKEAVTNFQKENNLVADGIFGPMTMMVIISKLKGRDAPNLTKDISGGLI